MRRASNLDAMRNVFHTTKTYVPLRTLRTRKEQAHLHELVRCLQLLPGAVRVEEDEDAVVLVTRRVRGWVRDDERVCWYVLRQIETGSRRTKKDLNAYD